MRRVLAAVLVLLPATAEACATCIGSPFGDRTYNWPYIGLILLPFMVAAVIGGVLARERSPFPSHSSALTMVTLEQMSRNVMAAVRLMPSTSMGFGQSALVARMAP